MSDPFCWGVSEAERAEAFPCDAMDFVSEHTLYRGIDIAAPPELVYRWLCQLRVAPYSYDWLDNFGRPSPARLTPGLERLALGQRMMLVFRLVGFDEERTMTVALGSRVGAALMGAIAGSYRVVPTAGGARLLAKILVGYPTGPYGDFLRRFMPHADLFMFKKQLRRLRRYAERDAAAGRLFEARNRMNPQGPVVR